MKKTITLAFLLTFYLFLSSQQLFSQGIGYNPYNGSFLNLASSAAVGGSSTGTFDVYFDFYKAGVTDAGGQGSGVSVVVKLRTQSADRDATYSSATAVFQTITAVYSNDSGSNDRYKATLPVGLPNGRYTWECEATHGGVTYKSWDYTTHTGSSLQYFTVGSTGIYRSMLITDFGSGNTYYDLLKFQPGNADLPTQLSGPNTGGFCSGSTFKIGAEINTYKNDWFGAGDVTGNRLYFRITAISASGTASCLNMPGSWNSFYLPYRDDCQYSSGTNPTYINTFASGGSCQIDNASKIDQRWDRRGGANSMVDILPAASAVCPVTPITGAITYKIEFYSETDIVAGGGNFVTRNPLAANTYYATNFIVNGLAITASNGFDAGGGCAAAVLPIQLLDFSARSKNNSIVLNWSTASEKNSSHFAIEHSTNGYDWHEITSVSAHKNSNTVQKYSTTDKNPYSEINYYRLREVDFDGSFTYSHTVTAYIEKANSLHLYPNPAGENITLELGTSDISESTFEFSLYDVRGAIVQQWQQNIESKNSRIERNISELNTGLYFLRIKNTNGTSVQESHFVKR